MKCRHGLYPGTAFECGRITRIGKMKKVTWIALLVIVGFYPVFWSYLVFGPMLFLAESEEPPYNIP